MSELIEDGVYEEHGTELARVEAHPVTLFGTTDPAAVIVKATEAAKPLAEVVRRQRLAVNIQGREHVRVEGWTLLGSMLGVFPVCVWTRKMEDGWEARVEARTRDGQLIGAAEAECLYSEKTWKSRDDYALRSMAQTRATSKALRQPLGFVMQLAGFDPTPAEEMPSRKVSGPEPHASEVTGPRKPTAPDASAAPDPDAGEQPSGPEYATAAQQRLIIIRARAAGLDDDQRHALTERVTGQPSSKAVPRALVNELLDAISEAAGWSA